MDNLKIDDKQYMMTFEAYTVKYDNKMNEGIFGFKGSPESLLKNVKKYISTWFKQGYLKYATFGDAKKHSEEIANSEEAKADGYNGSIGYASGKLIYKPSKKHKYGSVGKQASAVN